MIQSSKLVLIVVAASMLSCGELSMLQQNDEDQMDAISEPDEIILKQEAPAESSGAVSKVKFQFMGATAAAALRLSDSAAGDPSKPDINLGWDWDWGWDESKSLIIGDVTINVARFNIAALKLKPKKELNAEEVKAQEVELKEETATEDVIDETSGEAPIVVEPEEQTEFVDMMKSAEAALLAGPMRSSRQMPGRPEASRSKPKERGEFAKERGEKIEERQEELASKMKESLGKIAKRDQAVRFIGPVVFDAVAGEFEGDGIDIETLDGNYRRIEFKLKRNFSLESEDPLFGNVFVVRGTVKLEGEQVPFEMNWHRALNFRLVGEKGVPVSAEAASTVAVVFDLNQWFEGVDFSKAKVASDGKIYIDRRANHEIRRQISKNMKRNMRFGVDSNDDKSLGVSETVGAGEVVEDPEEPEAVSSETGEVIKTEN